MAAFCFDRAVWTLATAIEQDQEAATRKLPSKATAAQHEAARQKVLDRYLSPTVTPTKGRFRDPGQG